MKAQWENECISLSVLSMARVMIAQWENEYISPSVLSVARVQIPAMTEYFKGSFPGMFPLLITRSTDQQILFNRKLNEASASF